KAINAASKLETAAKGTSSVAMRLAMTALRTEVDALEGLVPVEDWPLPSYTEMLFIQ
ncbi:hypothetical protein MNBD_BACTEROID05-571, partial [hydrothermal vent metagenome]